MASAVAGPVFNYGTIEAPFFVGVMVSCALYGIVCAQTVHYYRAYPEDDVALKVFVGVLLLLETAHQILALEAAYYLFIECKLPEKTGNVIYVRVTFAASFAITLILTSLIQGFYGWRVWILSRFRRGGKWVIAVIAFLSFAQLGFGITDNVFLFVNPLLSSVHGPDLTALYSSQLATAMACDIFITLSLVYFLNGVRSGFLLTEKVLDRLIIFSVNIGLVTSAISVACFITFHALSKSTLFTAFVEVISKFYVNSALVTLNSRRSLRKVIDEPETFALSTKTLSKLLTRSDKSEPRPNPLVSSMGPSSAEDESSPNIHPPSRGATVPEPS